MTDTNAAGREGLCSLEQLSNREVSYAIRDARNAEYFGHRRGIKIEPSRAFDAGFSAGLEEAARATQPQPSPAEAFELAPAEILQCNPDGYALRDISDKLAFARSVIAADRRARATPPVGAQPSPVAAVRTLSPSERLHNICDALEEDRAVSPFTQEEWDRVDAETVRLNRRVKELEAAFASTMRQMVDRFLAWPLPQSVCADVCATNSNYSHQRSGTNLLAAHEAEAMLQYVVRSATPPVGAQPSPATPGQRIGDARIDALWEQAVHVGLGGMAAYLRAREFAYMLLAEAAQQAPEAKPATPGVGEVLKQSRAALLKMSQAMSARGFDQLIDHSSSQKYWYALRDLGYAAVGTIDDFDEAAPPTPRAKPETPEERAARIKGFEAIFEPAKCSKWPKCGCPSTFECIAPEPTHD